MKKNKIKLVKASLAVIASALIILIAGAWPLDGTPEVYRSGFLLLLGGVIGILSFCAGVTLTGKQWWRLLLSSLLTFIAAGCLCGAWLYTVAGIGFASGGEWRWLGSLGRWIMAAAMLGIVGVSAVGIFRLMTGRLWLAAVHFSLVAMGGGCFLDYCSEIKGTLRLPVPQNGEAPFMQENVYDGNRMHPFGFSLGVRQFTVLRYADAVTCRLCVYKNGQWQVQTELIPQNGILKTDDISVPLSELKIFPCIPHAMYVLEDGRVIVKNEAPVKSYEAVCVIETDGKKEEYRLRVNEPISHNGWLFYLMHCDNEQGKQTVYVTARCAPGRPWVIGGMVALMISVAFWCWLPSRKEETPLSDDRLSD